MDDVVPDLPQAVGRERRQKYQTPKPGVEPAMHREAVMAGIVTQDEKTSDEKAGRRAEQDLERWIDQPCSSAQAQGEQTEVGQRQQQCAPGVALTVRRSPGADDLSVRHRGIAMHPIERT